MAVKKLNLFYAAIFVSVYLTIWIGSIMFDVLKTSKIDYISAGIVFTLFFISVGITCLNGRWINSLFYYGVLFVNGLLVGISYFTIQVVVLYVLAIGQGALASMLITTLIRSNNLSINISALTLGIILGCIPGFILFDNVVYFGIAMTMILLLFFLKIDGVTISADEVQRSVKMEKHRWIEFAIISCAIFLEVNFIIWSLILKDESQNIFHQMTLVITLLMIFILRRYFSITLSKLSDMGWLFVSSVLLTVSIGLFYTFNITIPFILGFSLSLTILMIIFNKIFTLYWDTSRITTVMMMCAVGSFIFGLYVQNHIEFIRSIGMPEEIVLLSACQALVKEMASIAGLLVVFTGIVFLNRRKWTF